MIDSFLNTVLLGILVGVFKSDIYRILIAWRIYRNRIFDEDSVQILNDATGEWMSVRIEEFKMCMNSAKRGVFITYPNGSKEKFTFHKWEGLRKRTVPE